MPTKVWTASKPIPDYWNPYDVSTAPPVQVISLGVPVSPSVTLIRTIVDVSYSLQCMYLTPDTDELPPNGLWETYNVTAGVWVDPTGIVAAGSVPKPFGPSPHYPPHQVWQAMLYNQQREHLQRLQVSLTATWQPLRQGDSQAQRKQLPDHAMTSWLTVLPQTNNHFDGTGIEQNFVVRYAVQQLWEVE